MWINFSSSSFNYLRSRSLFLALTHQIEIIKSNLKHHISLIDMVVLFALCDLCVLFYFHNRTFSNSHRILHTLVCGSFCANLCEFCTHKLIMQCSLLPFSPSSSSLSFTRSIALKSLTSHSKKESGQAVQH